MGEKSKREYQQVADRDFHRSVKEKLTTESVLGIREMDWGGGGGDKKISLYSFPNTLKSGGRINNHSKWQVLGETGQGLISK